LPVATDPAAYRDKAQKGHVAGLCLMTYWELFEKSSGALKNFALKNKETDSSIIAETVVDEFLFGIKCHSGLHTLKHYRSQR